MPEPLSPEEVAHVARLARLRLDAGQLEAYRTQLSSVLEHIAMLERLDVENVEPMSHPLDLENRLADDVAGAVLPDEALGANAPAMEGRFLAVPKVLGDGGILGVTDPASVDAIARDVRSRTRSAVDVVGAALDRIDALNGRLHAFRESWRDHALESASAVDDRVAAGDDPGPLTGVPIAVKDNIVTDAGRTTCSSRILETFRSPYAATVTRRLVEAGAVLVGKTNCDEFAMGSSSEHCAFGGVLNPWDASRVPGGSSGGSAAAVAADLCPAALGSDTGGSVRQPAALCGVVGVKPTYGRVSRYGLVAFGSSLDQVGPITRSVGDAASVLGVIAGHDAHDSTSAPEPVPDYRADLDEPVENLRLGFPRQYGGTHADPAVTRAVTDAVERFAALGATIVDVDLPLTDYAVATYYVIAPAEASSNLARYDGIRYGRRARLESGESLFDLYARSRAEGFGPEVQRRIMLGTYVLSAGYYDAYYLRALKVRRLIKEEFDRAFEACDALVGPTCPVPAFPLGEKADPLSMYLCDVFTTGANIAGICGVSIPCGFAAVDAARLPVGLQIQCPAFAEGRMLRIARMFEAGTDFHRARPDLDMLPA